MIKVAGPRVALRIIDDAIQAHGGGGVSEDFPLAASYAHIRTLRIADGPDEVHNRSIARMEFARYGVPRPPDEYPPFGRNGRKVPHWE
jgi:acyl-CoA dehydrogenase